MFCIILLFVIYYIMMMHIIIITTHAVLLFTLNRAFKWASPRVNMTIQPPLSPGRLKEGCLFDVCSGCNGWRMTRGLQCTRFEVHTVDGREDMSILLLFI